MPGLEICPPGKIGPLHQCIAFAEIVKSGIKLSFLVVFLRETVRQQIYPNWAE